MDAAAAGRRMRSSEARTEGLVRGACAVLAAAAALLVGLDAQTETVLLIRKKATVKDVQALWVLAVAAGAAAGYHLLHLLRCVYIGRCSAGEDSPCRSSRALAWAWLLLDKSCLIALDGAPALQWNKVCNIYTRFCEQVAGSVACAVLAAAGSAVVSAISARNLFRLYPSLSHSQRSSTK